MGSCDCRLAKKKKKRTKIPERYICIQTSSMTLKHTNLANILGLIVRVAEGSLSLLVGGIGVLLCSFRIHVHERPFSFAVVVGRVLAAGKGILGQHVRVLGQILEGNSRGGSSCAGSVRPVVDSTVW